MSPKVFTIQNPDLSVVYKGYTMIYKGRIREKVWCDGVEPTRGKAERSAQALIKKMRKEKQSQPFSL